MHEGIHVSKRNGLFLALEIMSIFLSLITTGNIISLPTVLLKSKRRILEGFEDGRDKSRISNQFWRYCINASANARVHAGHNIYNTFNSELRIIIKPLSGGQTLT
jgi:hypothetical protein